MRGRSSPGRPRAWRGRVAIAALLGALSLALPTTALAAEPLVYSSLSPAEGASVPAGRQVTFEMRSSASYPVAPSIEVSTQPTLGQDGTLANDYLVDQALYLFRSDADPSAYRGTTVTNPQYAWIGTPGTYYWQVRASYEQDDPATSSVVFHDAIGPVQRVVVGGAAPTPIEGSRSRMTKAQAVSYLRPALRKIAGHRSFRLRRTCDRVDGETFNCDVNWWTSGRRGHGTYYTGDIELTHAGARIRYKFDGRKATAKCIKRRSIKRCLRRVQ